jgi:hypothetical protein
MILGNRIRRIKYFDTHRDGKLGILQHIDIQEQAFVDTLTLVTYTANFGKTFSANGTCLVEAYEISG